MSAAELIPEYVQAFALLSAGAWAYWRFFHQQSHQPATDIDIEITVVGTQGGFRILEVTAVLENKSLVRHKYEDFQMKMRYILGSDPIKDGSLEINYQLVFPHKIDARIGGAERLFGNVGWINPRQQFRHRYETFVPLEATMVRVHCRFAFHQKDLRLRRKPSKDDRVFVDAQKVLWISGEAPPRTAEPGGRVGRVRRVGVWLGWRCRDHAGVRGA